jgi:pimeloyl-ACP methyl ester carboxylesterase
LLRRNPPGIRTAILDGAYPPEVAGKLHLARAFVATLDRIYAACAKDEDCNEDFPNLRGKVEELLKRLAAQPISVESDPAPLLTGKAFRVNDVIFLSVVDSMFYTVDGIAKFPWLVDRLLSGKNDALASPLTDWDLVAFGPYITTGISYLVDCNDTPDLDDSEEKRIAREQPWLAPWIANATAYKPCPYWTKRKNPALDASPVKSDVPTLVIAGAFDLATPPAWGALAARGLSRARLLNVPPASHDASDQACARTALATFLLWPETDVSAACANARPHPDFKRKNDEE